ncbi:MAG: hypothetical protein M3Q44_03595 [bacterium]|nr:hypothetical protein [bacterium]
MHKDLLRGHGIPLWTDLIGNGYPIFAEGQMGEFYPLHLLLYLIPLPTIFIFNANLMLHYLLAGIFTYLYIKISIKLSQTVSILGALVFTFSGYMLTHLHQVNIILELTYFPLNLLLADSILKINKETKKSKIIVLTLILTLTVYLQMTAGHIEMVYYNLLFTGIYAAIRFFFDPSIREAWLKKVGAGFVAISIVVMLAWPQLYATYELVNFSQRETGISYENTTGTLWPLETLILFVNPKAFDVYRDEPGYSPNKAETVNIGALYPYVGILPLMLVVIAIISLKWKRPLNTWTLTFLTFLIFTYLYAVGRSTQLFSVIWEIIPGMKFFRFPIKAIYIIEFCIAVLASVGLQKIYEYVLNKTKNITTKNTQNQEIVVRNINSHGIVRKDPIGKNAGNILAADIVALVIIMISFADLWIFNRPTQPTIPASDWLKTPEFAQYINSQNSDCHCDENSNRYPGSVADQEPAPKFQNWRSYSHGTNNIDYTRIFDFPLQKDLQNILHIDFNMIHNISMNREWAVLFLQRQTLLNKYNTKIDFESATLTLPPEMKKSLDIQATRYLLSDLVINHPDLTLVKTHHFSSKVKHVLFLANTTDTKYVETDKAYLYENKTYFPRITLTPQSNAIYQEPDSKTADNILKKVLDPDFDPTKQTVIESAIKPSGTSAAEPFKSKYTILSYDPQNIVVQTESNAPGYLSFADTYYPGWEAIVDDQQGEVLKANYAFKAIAVPAGQHIVKVSFKPTHWKSSLIIVILGWSIVATISLYLLINKLTSQKIIQK